ncbi:MAG: hypothetical protein ABL883_10305 [Terricaulis sp.]
MSSNGKWMAGIFAMVAVALLIGGQVAILFVGVPILLVIYFVVYGVADRLLRLHNDQNNPWKTAILGVVLLATCLFCFWLASLTGWWD